jgi:ribonuclease G
MTRKRTRENLNRLLSESCFYCEGRGTLKSKKTICCEIFRDLEREALQSSEADHIYIKVHPDIDNALKEEEQESMMDIEKKTGRRIIILADDSFHWEQYEISP